MSKKPTTPTPELVWSEKRIAILKAMKALGAIGPGNGKTADEIAKKAGPKFTKEHVKHVCYKDEPLAKLGYVSPEKAEGESILRYTLTTKGKNVDLKAIGK